MKPRRSVLGMSPYSAPAEGRGRFLRLDMNENTVGCSPRVLRAVKRQLTRTLLVTYPEYQESLARIAVHFGREPEETLLTNGVDEAIWLLLSAFLEPGQRVVVAEPCFDMYRFYASLLDLEVVTVRRGADMQVPLDSLRRAARGARAVLVDNPNNPSGTVLPPRDLEALARDFPKALLLVDEAYYDFYGRTVLPLIRRYRNLVVARTFSKAHGLAALRLGCLFAHRETAAHLKKAQSPYSVNVVALVAACEAVSDQGFLRRYVDQVLASRRKLETALATLGVHYIPSQANFVLANFGERTAAVQKALRRSGILVRDRSHELPGWVRITLGTAPQMRLVIQTLRETLNRS